MNIEQSKLPQTVEQKDRKHASGFSESLSGMPGKTDALAKIFADAFESRNPSRA